MLVIGYSSYSCWKCIQYEPEYTRIHEQLKQLGVTFVRANADVLKSYASEHGATELPALVILYKNKPPLLYKGAHSTEPFLAYVHKLLNPAAVLPLKNKESVEQFLSSKNTPRYSLSTSFVIGFFSDIETLEEDDYEDFMLAADELKVKEDIYMAAVTSSKVSTWFKNNKTIDRTPSLLLVGESNEHKTINLDELYDEHNRNMGIVDWIIRNSVPLVGKLTGHNYRMYEKLGYPMLMMFLNLTNEAASSYPGRIIGGKTGGILNEVLLDEFRIAAKDHVDRISFVYLDGIEHQDQMRSVGLYGGPERLPSIAFNTKDGSKIPFPEELPINRDTLLEFCANYLGGKLKSEDDAKELAKKALSQTVRNTKNMAQRLPKKQAPEQVRGVAEQFGDGAAGDKDVKILRAKDFDEVVMNEEKDVLVMFHSTSCEPCAHFAVYFKRMSERFAELGISSLDIYRMDVTSEGPPAHYNLLTNNLPLLILFPGEDKNPPWKYFSGIGKVQPMMKWIQEHVSYPFELPHLPHLKERDKEAYKTQVREREVALEEKRRGEEEEMRREEELRNQYATSRLPPKNTKEDRSDDDDVEEGNSHSHSEF